MGVQACGFIDFWYARSYIAAREFALEGLCSAKSGVHAQY